MSLYRKLIYLLVGILLFMAGRSHAQTVSVLRYDSSLVKQIRPTETKEHEVFEEVDLGFAKEKENVGMNPIARFFIWLLEQIFGDSSDVSRRTMQWAFIWALVITGVIMAIWLFRKSEFGSFLRGNTKEAGFNFSDIDEDISRIDFDTRVQQAKESHDLRLALRWLYLKQLFLLNEHGKISWQPYKTNMDYANELAGSPLRQPFRDLSRIYEYVWYGDYPMTDARFSEAESEFTQFERQLHA